MEQFTEHETPGMCGITGFTRTGGTGGTSGPGGTAAYLRGCPVVPSIPGASGYTGVSIASGCGIDIKPVGYRQDQQHDRHTSGKNTMSKMSIDTSDIKPADVRTLRIYLAHNRGTLLSISDIKRIIGPELAVYLASAVPVFRSSNIHTQHALAQDIAQVMRDDRALVRLYEIGKAKHNPSGRSSKVHRPGAEPKL